MPLTSTQEASRLFKKSFGLAETTTNRQFFEETMKGRSATWPSSVIGQESSIPTTAPSGMTDGQTVGVVKRRIALSLTAVPGTTNAFYDPDMVNIIPFNFGDGSYNYVLNDSTGDSIPFGDDDWLVDTEAGVLSFYNGVPANMPPKLSFYKYVGLMGIVAGSVVPQVETVSRTIYVSSTGSDTTGDGTTAGTAFATLYHAITTILPQIYNCTITIQLGAGTFTYDNNCDKALCAIQYIYGDTSTGTSAAIIIAGTMVSYSTNTFTLDSVNKQQYNCVQGSVLTPGALNNMFAFYSGTVYVPIESNTTSAIISPYPNCASLNGVYTLGTTLNAAVTNINASVVFRYIGMSVTGTTSYFYAGTTYSSNFPSTMTQSLSFQFCHQSRQRIRGFRAMLVADIGRSA